jgi:hypothetical protein
MAQYTVKDDGDPRKYFIQIPNMIDDSDLSVYEFRLYVHLKRVAGDGGVCFQTTQTLAKACLMSTAAVARAKKTLADKKLIIIKEMPGVHGGRPYHEITIIDIWTKNISSYSQIRQVSTSNLQGAPQKLASYPGSIKEEPIKEEPIKNSSNSDNNHNISPVGILSKASGLSSFPGDNLQWIEVVYSMAETYGEERTIAAMKSACAKWRTSTNKFGRNYRKTDLRWINWAQEELASSPADYSDVDINTLTGDELKAAVAYRMAKEER